MLLHQAVPGFERWFGVRPHGGCRAPRSHRRRPRRVSGCASSASPARSAWARARPPRCSARAACRSTMPTRPSIASIPARRSPPIEAAFPGVTADGAVDRARLAERVVGDPAALARLEAIVHPLVRAERSGVSGEMRGRRDGALVVLDVPLLFETGAAERVDVIVVVTADPEIQRAACSRGPDMTEAKFARVAGPADARRGKAPARAFPRRFGPGLRDAGRQVERRRACLTKALAAVHLSVGTDGFRCEAMSSAHLASGSERTRSSNHAGDRLRHRNDRPRLPERRPADRDRLRRAAEPHPDRPHVSRLHQSAPAGRRRSVAGARADRRRSCATSRASRQIVG